MSKGLTHEELARSIITRALQDHALDDYDGGVHSGDVGLIITINGCLWRDVRRAFIDEHPLRAHRKLMEHMKPKHANDYPFQCRYEETGDTYDFRLFLSVHHDHSAPYPMRLSGLSLDAPDWLKNIVSIGKLGGYVVEVKSPPPGRILWFGVDSDGSLGAFLNFNEG